MSCWLQSPLRPPKTIQTILTVVVCLLELDGKEDTQKNQAGTGLKAHSLMISILVSKDVMQPSRRKVTQLAREEVYALFWG